MKSSLLLIAAASLAVVGCSKGTHSADTTAADTHASTSADYTATGNATVAANQTARDIDASMREAGRDIRNAAERTGDKIERGTERMGDKLERAGDRVGNDLENAARSTKNALSNAADSVATSARITEWKLSQTDLQADLAAGREIVRTKANAAGAPTGSTDKSMIESMVKGRIEADSQLAALDLDIEAEGAGHIELEGKANSADQIGRAIALALDTEGVTKVTSKVKLNK